MKQDDIKKYGYFRALKEEKRRTVEIKYNIKSYEELKKVIKMTKNMTKNKEIAEIQFNLVIGYYIE